MSAIPPRVLFVYFTVSQQTLRVVEAMTDTLRKRGCDVQQARIELTDARYAERFSRFPFKHPYLAGTVLAGKRFAAIVVCHRYWKNNLATVKKLGIKHGGKFVNGIHFISAGGPIGSMLALMSFFGTGVIKDRYLGLKIPPANLQPSYVREAQAFADELADGVGCASKSERSMA